MQHGRCVGDVLRGRTPVAILAQFVFATGIDVVDHGNDGVTDLLGFGFQLDPVDGTEFAVLHDLFSGFLGDYSQLALYFGQCPFNVQILGGAVLVRPDVAHGRVTEHVAENFGIDDGG